MMSPGLVAQAEEGDDGFVGVEERPEFPFEDPDRSRLLGLVRGDDGLDDRQWPTGQTPEVA